ncbi:MAG: Tim44 domain-containing protein [Alphaproteobacteria bacterium]|nr:Tim44 domain-containing protein [Alphaproteobacteria bacterium]
MNSQLLFIVIIAMVAGIILFRLYSVLGRRTGQERQRDPFGRVNRPGPENLVSLPERSARAETLDSPADPVARGLFDITLADRNFDEGHFIEGAKSAYEIIITAFAQGDRAALRPLLSDEVYAAFDGVIREREVKHLKVSFTFIGFGEVRITQAVLKNRMAEVTVNFAANFISATTDADGKVVHGDPNSVRGVADVWTFARDVRASDPNWTIVATHGDEAA